MTPSGRLRGSVPAGDRRPGVRMAADLDQAGPAARHEAHRRSSRATKPDVVSGLADERRRSAHVHGCAGGSGLVVRQLVRQRVSDRQRSGQRLDSGGSGIPDSLAHHGVAVGPGRRGHQDQEVVSEPCSAEAAVRAGATRAEGAPGGRQGRAGRALARRPGHLLFTRAQGTVYDAAGVRRGFRRVAKAAGLDAAKWTPRELRHSFVLLLSDGGMSIEQISLLVGHSGTTVTELVYRKQPSAQDQGPGAAGGPARRD